jgi:hypothetical protein
MESQSLGLTLVAVGPKNRFSGAHTLKPVKRDSKKDSGLHRKLGPV